MADSTNGKLAVLSPEQIAKVRAGVRGDKGFYKTILENLMESDEAAIDVMESYPNELEGKAVSTVALGIRGAAKSAEVADEFIITEQKGSLFILVVSRLDQEQEAA